MERLVRILKCAVAVTLLSTIVASGQEDPLDELFDALLTAEGEAVSMIEFKIMQEWSRSGSASMDLLLDRGRSAMDEEDWELAIEHLSALVDHAPDFAEGWNARATAYFQVGRYGESLADIRRTLALNPRHFGAMSGLGIIMAELGQSEVALEAWRAVEVLSPNRPGLDETLLQLEREILGQSL